MRHLLRRLVIGSLVASVVVPAAAAQAQEPRVPLPEPNFATTIIPQPCALERDDKYERALLELDGWTAPDYVRYPGRCQRLRFAYGPILVKPGQNDVLVVPVTIEKPWQDGYVTRFAPNLVRIDGTTPPVEQVHLHHGTWLSVPTYGSGPFFASGEEKTIAPFPRGYGMPVKATDQWLLLYMVHSAVQQPMEAYITYDVDFIPKAKGDEIGMKAAYPVWSDVRPSGYPVFNVERKYGGADGECTWPKEQCASLNSWGKTEVGQGQPGNGVGTDLAMPARGGSMGQMTNFQGGTLIGLGGHLHPGGLRNELDLVRGGSAKRIYTGVAQYWDREAIKDPSSTKIGGGPPTSWDYSAEILGLPFWGVRVKPGDKLRSNAVYDTAVAATYENMGIVVSLMVPDNPDGTPNAPGVDPFAAPVDNEPGCPSGGIRADPPTLCTRGLVSHGHNKENGNYSGPSGTWSATRGQPTSEVGIANFLYAPGDFGLLSMTGVPQVKLGSNLRFTSPDGIAQIYHSVTACKFPCLGPTGAAFPIPDGQTSQGRDLDFDSGQLGIGIPEISGQKQEITWSLPVTPDAGFKEGEIVTYFCRIHPSMRGAFEVAK